MGLLEMLMGEEPWFWEDMFFEGDLGERGEYYTSYALENGSFPGYKYILKNVYIPLEDGSTTEIDSMMIHEKGIIVVESKNYSGWIYGEEDAFKWCKSLRNGKKEFFYNPIKQNQKHIQALSKLLGLPETAFFSCIVFSNRCELKDVPYDTDYRIIVQRTDMMPVLRWCFWNRPVIYSLEDLARMKEILLPYQSDDPKVREEHIKKVNEKIHSMKCPFCGKELVQRKGRFGYFIGCTGYPVCKYTRDKK